MFDIHCHMLPGVDDGPADTKEALEMIEASYIDGIRHIAMTSHLNHPLGFSGEDDYDGIFCDFKKLVEEKYPDLEIYPGSEVYISRKMLSEMDKIDIRTINNTKYVLVEFSRNVKMSEMDMAVHELKILGYSAIIAHIEQYHSVREKYDDIRQLKADGAVIQCNRDSFSKRSRYSRVVDELMKRNMVDIAASDCHNMDDRAPGLKKTYGNIKRKFGREAADRIFLKNPERIIKGEDLEAFTAARRTVSGNLSKKRFSVVAAAGILISVLFMSRGILPAADIEVAIEDDGRMTAVEPADHDDSTAVVTDDKGENDDETGSEDNADIIMPSGEVVTSTDGDVSSNLADESNSTAEETNAENNTELVEKSHEEILVGSYVSYLEDLESEYMATCEEYYSMLKDTLDRENEAERDEEIEEILDELGRVENGSDNQVYKVLYDMQNDLEEYKYDVAVVQELREHYLDVKIKVSEEYKNQLEEYGNSNI